MQIVIDISEEDFKIIKHNVKANNPLSPMSQEGVMNMIANGKPLPKRHGDLKDMNDLCYKSRYGCKGNCDYLHVCNLYKSPIIIEADKAESEG